MPAKRLYTDLSPANTEAKRALRTAGFVQVGQDHLKVETYWTNPKTNRRAILRTGGRIQWLDDFQPG